MKTPEKALIGYKRVSTQKQGQSGLGLEAQDTALDHYASQSGGRFIATYTEVESGKNDNRPELQKAILHAKRSKATLVVAKLDRLGRNVRFLAELMDTAIEFVCCDNPHANRFTLHIMAALAEHERVMISQRTKEALAVVKSRGVKLGSNRDGHWTGREDRRLAGLDKGRGRAVASIKKKADEAYADLVPLVAKMRASGSTLNQIAERINTLGHTTRNGKPWSHVQVLRLLRRSESVA